MKRAQPVADDGTPPIASFATARRIRFSDCDPAGIVFYPQYFVMLNGVVEDWIDALGIGYERLVAQRRVGLPTVSLQAEFQAISRFGDDVTLALDVLRLGQRSLTLALRCVAADGGELRMAMRQVLVTTSLDTHRAVDIPADLRQAIERSSREERAPSGAQDVAGAAVGPERNGRFLR